jgi:hypothetical protein
MKTLIAATVAGAALAAGGIQAQDKYRFEDIVYLSCQEAWEKSGRSVDEAFEMIRVLARFSIEKRSLALPDDEAVGGQFGDLIQASCTDEPDDLLFNAVDKSLRRLLGS